MSKYVLEWLEQKPTSTGKERAIATIKDDKGVSIEGVTLWGSNWTNFKDLKSGMEVEADYKEVQNGQYLNKTLYQATTYKTMSAPAGGTVSSPTGGYKGGAGMSKMMDKKIEGVREAQERKNDAMTLAGTARDATLLTIEWAKQMSASQRIESVNEDMLKEQWVEFRKFLLANYDDAQVTDKPPFN